MTDKIGLESRRYIGNKNKLSEWIFDAILKETSDRNSFLDIFAGTASISKKAFQYFDRVIVNDILFSNYVIYKAFFESGDYDSLKIESILNSYNLIESEHLKDNYFSLNFGNKFFDNENAKLIGYIREDIENHKNEFSEKEYYVLIATLIYNIDRIANTVGHFDAYIKKTIVHKKLHFRLIDINDFPKIEIYRQDANLLAPKITADIAYLDPPYNSRQYSRFYHIYENLVKWEKPELFGVALKPEKENMSEYCTARAKYVLKDLVDNLKVKWIVTSYNNTYTSKSNSSKNKITLDEIEMILNSKGKTKVIEMPYRFFNTGKSNFGDHKEFLFLTKVENEQKR